METRRSSEIERSWQRVPFPFHAGGCNCRIHEQFSTLCLTETTKELGPPLSTRDRSTKESRDQMLRLDSIKNPQTHPEASFADRNRARG